MPTILIVDDLSVNLELLEARLGSAGFDTLSAHNGIEALEVLRDNAVDMIISDILMPKMDGYQFCRECKKSINLKKIPFIFYTATYTEDKDKAFALSLGAEDFVIKPTEKDRFMEIVESLLMKYKTGTIRPSNVIPIEKEETYYRDYNERLIFKLEKKIKDLEAANRMIETEHGRAEEEIKANLARLESLINISQHDSVSLQELLDHALNEAVRLTKSRIGYIYFYSEEKREFRLNNWTREAGNTCEVCAPQSVFLLENAGMWGKAVQQMGPVVANDFQFDHSLENSHSEGEAHLTKLLSTPVLVHGAVVAVVGVANKDRDYDDADVRQLQLLMDGVWRIRSQRETENERARLVSAIEQAHEGIAILGTNGDVRYVNSAMRAQLGLTKDNASVLKLLDENTCRVRSDEDTISNIIKRGVLWTGQIQCQREDSTMIDCETTFTPIQDEFGKLDNVILVSRDITEELKMADRLRQSQKMEAIGTLAGGIAHDFNNILMGISGFAELTLMDVENGDSVQRYQNQLLTACGRARDLVSQILTFSRQTEQAKNPVHVVPIISETCRFLRASLPSSIHIVQEYRAGTDLIMADPTQLQQVIMNLCTNAGHAMQLSGGVLEISTDILLQEQMDMYQYQSLQAGRYIKISVKDNGCGIPDQIKERVFEPYFTTKEKGEGTGLGLAVVHGIVNDHGGNIQVYSEEGKGTVFHILFPLAEDETASSASLQDNALPRGEERILVVDDEENIRHFVRTALQRLGYTVTAVGSGKECLDLFLKEKDEYDLILTDKTMRYMNGFALAREILKHRKDIPIVLCTGFIEKTDQENAISLGIEAVVAKPLDSVELASVIRKTLDKKS